MSVMIIKAVYRFVKKLYKRRKFYMNAYIGEEFCCIHNSDCFNRSGIKERIKIGDSCEICGVLMVDNSGSITIGHHTTIRYDTRVESTVGIYIGNHVIISNNVIIRDNNSHPVDPQKRIEMCESGFHSQLWSWEHSDSKPIIIHDNVWIGERAIIYKGVEIGKGSVIAGGAVVTKSIPDYVVAAGNPARVVKEIIL